MNSNITHEAQSGTENPNGKRLTYQSRKVSAHKGGFQGPSRNNKKHEKVEQRSGYRRLQRRRVYGYFHCTGCGEDFESSKVFKTSKNGTTLALSKVKCPKCDWSLRPYETQKHLPLCCQCRQKRDQCRCADQMFGVYRQKRCKHEWQSGWSYERGQGEADFAVAVYGQKCKECKARHRHYYKPDSSRPQEMMKCKVCEQVPCLKLPECQMGVQEQGEGCNSGDEVYSKMIPIHPALAGIDL